MSAEQQGVVPRTSEQRYAEAKQLELEKIARQQESGVWYMHNGPRSCVSCVSWHARLGVHAQCTNSAVILKHHECSRARTDAGLCGPEGAFYAPVPPVPQMPVKKSRSVYRRRAEDTFWVVLVCGVWFGVFLLMNMM